MSTSEEKLKFYSLTAIEKYKAQYNIIFGERSNGKTYALLEKGLVNYLETGKKMAYIRRWKEDFRGKRGESLFEPLIKNNVIQRHSDGQFDSIRYYSGKWYLGTYNEKIGSVVAEDKPFCYGFSLNDMEHDKSSSYPDVTTVVFDEFLTRKLYLPDEFVLFMNTLSTIIRYRRDVTIYMLGNTVNKYCPYFKEMGLGHVSDMDKGKIEVYTYGTSELKVAVEYADSPNKTKPSDVYFAFNNPKLEMITGGAWELAMYPHLPRKFDHKDIQLSFFVDFNSQLIQGDIVELDDCSFIYFHDKTTPIKNEDEDIIFTDNYDPRPNHFRNIRKPVSELERRISVYFKQEKLFFQNNEVGELLNNYLKFCQRESVIRA